MRAFIFPGQGAQFVGMGKDLADNFSIARHTFEEVDDALSQNLSQLIFEGPEDKLNLTENTQPALMAVSMAVVNVLTREGGIKLDDVCSYVAGHSLGEYSALTAAGALDLTDTAKLLKLRGQSMQKAVPVGQGAMAAILGLELEDVQEIVRDAAKAGATDQDVCEVANDNSPGQVVVSGHKAAVEAVMAMATDREAKRTVPLPVSAPFHCTLMAPAAQTMAQALADTNIRPPLVPLIANVTAEEVKEPSVIRRLLVDQITGTVKWRESIMTLKDKGVDHMAELGAGKVLRGLNRRIDRDIKTVSVCSADDIDAFLESLS